MGNYRGYGGGLASGFLKGLGQARLYEMQQQKLDQQNKVLQAQLKSMDLKDKLTEKNIAAQERQRQFVQHLLGIQPGQPGQVFPVGQPGQAGQHKPVPGERVLNALVGSNAGILALHSMGLEKFVDDAISLRGQNMRADRDERKITYQDFQLPDGTIVRKPMPTLAPRGGRTPSPGGGMPTTSPGDGQGPGGAPLTPDQQFAADVQVLGAMIEAGKTDEEIQTSFPTARKVGNEWILPPPPELTKQPTSGGQQGKPSLGMVPGGMVKKQPQWERFTYIDNQGRTVEHFRNAQTKEPHEGVKPHVIAPIKAASPEAAARVALAVTGVKNFYRLQNMLYKDGQVNKKLILMAHAPMGGVSDGRNLLATFLDALDSRGRAASGAAMPESEVKNYKVMFFPSPLDNELTIKTKMARFKDFMTAYIEAMDPNGFYRGVIDKAISKVEADSQSGGVSFPLEVDLGKPAGLKPLPMKKPGETIDEYIKRNGGG